MIWPWIFSENFLIALSFSVTNVANGAAGAGFFSALINSVAKCVAASTEEIPDIVVLSVNNSTVSVISYALVLEM